MTPDLVTYATIITACGEAGRAIMRVVQILHKQADRRAETDRDRQRQTEADRETERKRDRQTDT